MIIDYESFTGLLSVGINPDTGAPSITRDAELGKIESYISVYEQEYLIRILGEDMCKAFTDYLAKVYKHACSYLPYHSMP